MQNLKFLIWLLDDNDEVLKRAFATLYYRYDIKNFDIVGILVENKIFFQGKELTKFPWEKVLETSFDYVIVAGVKFNSAVSDYSPLKKTLAEKINVPHEAIIFDFELCSEQFTFPKVCLVVIFNHRYDGNLPLLRKIYGKKFSNIRFLMPFYDGSDTDVIPVYESSYQLQGYLIQAYDKLKDIPCSHYLFIGDDLIINPAFDELNFVGRTKMHGKKFLTTKLTPLNSPNRFRWFWTAGSSKPFYNTATSWKGSLYTYEEAILKFNDFFGVEYKEVYDEAFFGDPKEPGLTVLGNWKDAKGFSKVVNCFIMTNRNSFHIPYPMASGYSDIFCVDKDSLFEFSRLCGIFSGMNMFAEIAMPTAAVLTYKCEDTKLFQQGSHRVFWGNKNISDFENKYDKDFSRLYDEWNEKIFYTHPVKLSRWKNV